jgi:hypothetical protein
VREILVPDVERVRDQLYLYRALTAIVNGLNALIGNVQAGQATLVAGTTKVSFAGLTPASRITATHARPSGTPGTLSVDPQKYDLVRKNFTIDSTSASDTSLVTWLLVN